MFPSLILASVLVAPVPKVPALRASVFPLATDIYVHDAVTAYVVLENPTRETYQLRSHHELDVQEDNVWAEVKGPQDKDFRRVKSILQSNKQPKHGLPPHEVERRKQRQKIVPDDNRCCTFTLLDYSDKRDGKLFDVPGDWLLRAVVLLEDREVASSPVKLTAIRLTGKAAEAHEKCRCLLSNVRTFGPEIYAEISQVFDESFSDLKGTSTANGITTSRLLHDLECVRLGKSKKTYDEALKPIQEHLKHLTAVEQEFLCFQVAASCREARVYEHGLPFFERIRHFTPYGNDLKPEYEAVKARVK